MDKLEDFLKYSVLFSYYGELFPKKKRQYLELYLEENSSLSEIAEQCGVTRQAVFDNIKKGVQKLDEYESKLGIFEKKFHYGESGKNNRGFWLYRIVLRFKKVKIKNKELLTNKKVRV